MKIGDLKDKNENIYQLAVNNTIAYRIKKKLPTDQKVTDRLSLGEAFAWSKTLEGTSFWSGIASGRISATNPTATELAHLFPIHKIINQLNSVNAMKILALEN